MVNNGKGEWKVRIYVNLLDPHQVHGLRGILLFVCLFVFNQLHISLYPEKARSTQKELSKNLLHGPQANPAWNIGSKKEIVREVARGDKDYLRKSADLKAQTSNCNALVLLTGLITVKLQIFVVRYPFSYFWLETGSYKLIFVLSTASKQNYIEIRWPRDKHKFSSGIKFRTFFKSANARN